MTWQHDIYLLPGGGWRSFSLFSLYIAGYINFEFVVCNSFAHLLLGSLINFCLSKNLERVCVIKTHGCGQLINNSTPLCYLIWRIFVWNSYECQRGRLSFFRQNKFCLWSVFTRRIPIYGDSNHPFHTYDMTISVSVVK